MQKNRFIMLPLVLLLMMACAFPSLTGAQGGSSGSTGGGGAGGTATAGSPEFSAKATSPQSILLT